MKKFIVIITAFCLSALSLSGQVMPSVRIPTPEETRILQKANNWHTTAVTSSVLTAGLLGVAGIYTIEKNEAEFVNKYNTDKVIVSASLMMAGATAFLATVSWTEYTKKKHKLDKNKLLLKTIPSGLIIEF